MGWCVLNLRKVFRLRWPPYNYRKKKQFQRKDLTDRVNIIVKKKVTQCDVLMIMCTELARCSTVLIDKRAPADPFCSLKLINRPFSFKFTGIMIVTNYYEWLSLLLLSSLLLLCMLCRSGPSCLYLFIWLVDFFLYLKQVYEIISSWKNGPLAPSCGSNLARLPFHHTLLLWLNGVLWKEK